MLALVIKPRHGFDNAMLDFTSTATAKADLYRDLLAAADALTEGETDAIANMANIAALMFDWLPDLNWAGFYRVMGDELVLGPFQGRPACIRIPFGQGVCGTAASTAQSPAISPATRRARPTSLCRSCAMAGSPP